jgi:hypothetical protein
MQGLASLLRLRLRLALLALATVALVATGWAHRAPDNSDKVLAFMAATGATPADFCGDVGGGPVADPLCQACQIAAGADLPTLAGVFLPQKLRPGPAPHGPFHGVAIVRVRDPAHAPQGPPVA